MVHERDSRSCFFLGIPSTPSANVVSALNMHIGTLFAPIDGQVTKMVFPGAKDMTIVSPSHTLVGENSPSPG